MKKIPTIFKRNPENLKEITREPHQDCAWVFNGEGTATRKYDGTCCRVKDGVLWKRRELKAGEATPTSFEEADFDPVTGKTVGWVLVSDSNEDKWHRAAFDILEAREDGTYELCGPKVQGNAEGYDVHVLIPHTLAQKYVAVERSYEGIKEFLSTEYIEGLVFHHPDGRMAKIKKRDFGMGRSA